MKPAVYLIGGGGHTRSLLAAGFDADIRGYVDVKPNPDLGINYVGNDKDFLSDDPAIPMPVHIAVISDKDCTMALRRKIIEHYKKNPMVSLIAPTAEMAPGTVIGAGSALLRACVINGSKIGKYCVVNTGAILEHDVDLGENVFIGPGAVVCGGVTIGDDCYIGANATIRNGVTISSGVTVGMGSVVIHDITSPGTYAGNPCRKIK